MTATITSMPRKSQAERARRIAWMRSREHRVELRKQRTRVLLRFFFRALVDVLAIIGGATVVVTAYITLQYWS